MKQYSFLNESSRTILKHAKELKSKHGQLILKRATSQMKHGKDAAKNLAELNKHRGELMNAVKSAKLEVGAWESAKKGLKAKHGRSMHVTTPPGRKLTLKVDRSE